MRIIRLASCLSLFSAALLLLPGCETVQPGMSRAAMMAEMQAEQPGDYYIGRRYFKNDYKFWGYIRKPGQPWNTARLVMLNENKQLAPDREGGTLGVDNGYEYRLSGRFSGETVYEPSSNGFYPEFVLTGAEVRSRNPAPIFDPLGAALDPKVRMIVTPY